MIIMQQKSQKRHATLTLHAVVVARGLGHAVVLVAGRGSVWAKTHDQPQRQEHTRELSEAHVHVCIEAEHKRDTGGHHTSPARDEMCANSFVRREGVCFACQRLLHISVACPEFIAINIRKKTPLVGVEVRRASRVQARGALLCVGMGPDTADLMG